MLLGLALPIFSHIPAFDILWLLSFEACPSASIPCSLLNRTGGEISLYKCRLPVIKKLRAPTTKGDLDTITGNVAIIILNRKAPFRARRDRLRK